jgi:hypothetical protein
MGIEMKRVNEGPQSTAEVTLREDDQAAPRAIRGKRVGRKDRKDPLERGKCLNRTQERSRNRKK